MLEKMDSSSDLQDTVVVRLAQNKKEIEAAQKLRYKVFYEEYGAEPSPEMAKQKRDFDPFDDVADHLIVYHGALDQEITDESSIIGTYRLLRREIADDHGRFYTSDEYDITPLLKENKGQLELGRSCVLVEYRTRPVMHKLWQGITNYILDHNIEYLFGCASFGGTDVDAVSKQLSYLHHYHRAPENLRVRALDNRYIEMNHHKKEDLDVKEVFSSLPPLIKGYLRVGALVGDGAVIDTQFNTIDVCMIMPTSHIPERYIKHYTRGHDDLDMGNSPFMLNSKSTAGAE